MDNAAHHRPEAIHLTYTGDLREGMLELIDQHTEKHPRKISFFKGSHSHLLHTKTTPTQRDVYQ